MLCGILATDPNKVPMHGKLSSKNMTTIFINFTFQQELYSVHWGGMILKPTLVLCAAIYFKGKNYLKQLRWTLVRTFSHWAVHPGFEPRSEASRQGGLGDGRSHCEYCTKKVVITLPYSGMYEYVQVLYLKKKKKYFILCILYYIINIIYFLFVN